MEFKIPKAPIITGRFGIRHRLERNYHGCPVTKQNEIDIVKTIGRGSFGVVKLCKKKNSKMLILKEMIDHNEDQEKLFVKEAKMLNEIQHQNIVRFDSILEPIHPDTFGFLMEYVYFDFVYFGQDEKISSLKDFLVCMDDIDAKGFEHFPVTIAADITRGLSFLHSRDVVHRDLKPANILVSNQHYTSENLSQVWNTQPIIAKITDFGESRATMVQTASLIHTKTSNISRGTPVFMAPEIHDHDGKSKHGIEDMKGMDIWSLAMIFYLLTNLDKKYPFQEEISELQNAGVSSQNIMCKVFEKQPYPKHGMKYSEHRNRQWKLIAKIFDMCVHCNYDQRPTAEKILLMFEGNKRDKESKRERNVFEDFNLSKYDEKASPDQSTGTHVEQSESPPELPTSKRAKTENLLRKPDQSYSEHVAPQSEKTHQTTTPEMMSTEIEMSSPKHPAASSVKNCTQTETDDLNLNEKPSSDFYQVKENTTCYTVVIEEGQMNLSESQNTEMYSLPSLNSYTSEKGKGPVCNIEYENESAIDATHSDEDDFSVAERIITDKDNITISLTEKERSQRNKDYESLYSGKVSVMGDFHQASHQIFKHPAAGSQCSSICLISAVAAESKLPTEWTSADVNSILIEGDKIHLQVLKNEGWPHKRVESRLDIDELPHSVNITFNGKAINADVSVLRNIYCGMGQEIRNLLMKSLSISTGGKISMIMRVQDKCRAVFANDNKSYSILDPHACNSDGNTYAEGAACLLHFETVEQIIDHLENLISMHHNEQVDLAIADVELLTETSLDKSGSNTGSSFEDTTKQFCPVYKKQEKGLSLNEIVQLCAFSTISSDQVCKFVPQPEENSVFVIDLEKVEVKDLPCDDSGSYSSHSSPTVVVKVKSKDNKVEQIKTISRRKVSQDDPILSQKNIFTVKRMYSEREDRTGLGKTTRIISKVYSCHGLAKYALIQYVGVATSSFVGHGNSQDRKKPYIRTKPSVIAHEKHLLQHETPKKVISLIEKEKGGPINMLSSSEGPRDRSQLYNLKRKIDNRQKSRNTGPVIQPNFTKLIADMDSGKFVKNVDFSFRSKQERIHPNTFAMTDNAVTWIKKFCQPTSSTKSQLGIDMTYKVGPFYTTCLSFPHPHLVHKSNKHSNPTIFAGMMTSTGRTEQDYRYLAHQMKSCGITNLIYGTDGELALEKGFEAIYPIDTFGKDHLNIKLRCFNHVKDDLLAELKKDPTTKDCAHEIIDKILGKELNGTRIPGLVDVEADQYDRKYQALAVNWPMSFRHYIESTRLRVRSLKSTFLKSMGKEVRIKAGLGNPPHKFDNQRAESINSILKESIGGQFVDQSAVHGLVYDNIIIPQENEMVKAIYGCGEYRLTGELQKYEISHQQWKTMTAFQRQVHVSKILNGNLTEDRPQTAVIRKLSVQPQDCADYLTSLPTSRIAQIWNTAEKILSVDSIRELDNGNYCIAEEENACIVKQEKKSFLCNCADYMKLKICPHVLVVADQKHCIMNLISNYKFNPSAAVNKHNIKGAGERKTKKPRRGSQNVKRIPIEKYSVNVESTNNLTVDLKKRRPFQFFEIWHNDEQFKVQYITSTNLRKKKVLKCMSCCNIISKRNALAPYDIVITHMERYVYPYRLENGEVEMRPTISKKTPKIYCVKRDCLLKRHPYFWQGLLSFEGIVLSELHKKLFLEEFDFHV